MDFFETLQTSTDSLKRNKLRSSLTALGIIIGISAIILLISIGSGLQQFVSSQFEKLGANSIFIAPGKIQFGPQGGPPRSLNKITFKIAQDLEKNKGSAITEVWPFIEIAVTASSGKESKVTTLAGTNSNYFKEFDIAVDKGRIYNQSDDKAARRVAVIGKTIAEDLYKNQNPTNKTISLSQKKFKIIGVLEPQGNVGGIDIDSQVLIPLNSARRLTGSDQVNSILVRTTSTETLDEAKKQVEKVLLRSLSEDDFTIFTQEQLLSSILQILSALTFVLGAIAAISLVVGGVGISNIMLVSVTERTREIGLRKAVGATPKNILFQFLIEAIILSLFGGLIGVSIGYLGSLIIGQFLKTTVPLWSVTLGLGFSTLVGIIFGVAPAIRASRLEPITALRYE